MRYVFDIEADDLYDEVKVIHCIVLHNLDSGNIAQYGPNELDQALQRMSKASLLVGHNILNYDLPVLKKLKDWQPHDDCVIRDTLILSKLAFSDLQMNDFKSSRKDIKPLTGSHSLKAWGIRLNEYKGDFGETEGAFKEYSPEMLEYCTQDVKLNVKLYEYLMRELDSEESIDLEHRFAQISETMCRRGFTFNLSKAEQLCKIMDDRAKELDSALQEAFPPVYEEMKTPAYYTLVVNEWDGEIKYKCATKSAADQKRKQMGLKPKEVQIIRGPNKIKVHPFNPGSRKQIAERLLEKYAWESPKRTEPSDTHPEGQPKIDDETLMMCFAPEAELLIEYLMLVKRFGQIRDGEKAWIKLVKPDGKIYHYMNTIGCATHRASHANPNLGQVPSVEKKKPLDFNEYGYECRELFEPSPGYTLVGSDLSGIEARLMGHFLYPYDGGKFIDILLNGDIHQVNADNLECERKFAKNIYYAYMYGAGNFKLQIMHPKRMPGKAIRERLERGLTGLEQLVSDVKRKASRGFLSPLDGRKLPIRSEHAAFNTLLQGSAAIVMKRWVVTSFEEVKKRGLDAHLLAVIHDETQTEVIPSQVEEYADISMKSIKQAQQFYKLNVPLDGEYKVGFSWAECH